jgi:signal transduction histidine kinase
MRRAPIRIRTFFLGTFLLLVLLPALAAGAAWLIEREHQQAGIQRRVDTAFAYLASHRIGIREPAPVRRFATLLARLDLRAQLVAATTTPPGKSVLYVSPDLTPTVEKGQAALRAKARGSATPPPTAGPGARSSSWTGDSHRVLSIGTRKSPALLAADLYYRPAPRADRALVALVAGVVVLLAGLAVATWLAGRWMVVPLTRLSAEVDRVAGGDLAIAVPRSRVGEIANIAQAVEGMTAALGETERRRAEADEARRFLVTSVAHDLRTPLFALRGHLQAIGAGLGDPAVHLERAEARADALERLVANLFAYTRDDYAQPALRLETVPVADLVDEVAAGLEHAARLGENTFELGDDRELAVVVDRDRAKRALTNVLDNALRHSPAGAPVHLGWAAADDSTAGLTVRDHGPGVDPELLPHVFEPGIRGSGADGGAGLGLTIARRLLEQQGATLTVRNGPTGGAVVDLTLRRAPSAGPPAR